MSKYLDIANRALETLKPLSTGYELNELYEKSPYTDKQQQEAFADLVAITKMRQQGQIPAHYTATTECRRCGVVPIFEGVSYKVDGCPWCFNRVKGLPMPQRKNHE